SARSSPTITRSCSNRPARRALASNGSVSDTNPIWKTTKTRRLVSAWMIQEEADLAVAEARAFEDIFDQVILICRELPGDASLPAQGAMAERRVLRKTFSAMGVSVLNDFAGGWEGGFQEVARSPKLVQRLVTNMVDDCVATGADGVDI